MSSPNSRPVAESGARAPSLTAALLLNRTDPRPVHFIGIAGAGMSALAELLARRGVRIQGTDANPAGAPDLARYGITVNAVAPGYVDTEMVRAIAPEVLQTIIDKIPVGRLAKPEDVARCVNFLVADDADFITGTTLSVNGGQSMA